MSKPNLSSAIDTAIDASVASETTTPPEPTQTETPVTTETPEPAETAPETTPEPAATEPVIEPGDDDIDNLSVSSEELARIKSDPALYKLYKGMNKNYTQKTMAVAQERQLIDFLKNPETRADAVRMIANAAGYDLARPEAPKRSEAEAAVDATMAELNKVFDPTVSAALKPVLEQVAKDAVKTMLESEVKPLREATSSLTQQAWRDQSEAEVRAFRSAHPDVTPEIESKMAALFTKIPPSEDIDPSEYMEYLRRIVVQDISKSAATKEVTTRMAKAAAAQEPKGGVQAARVNASSEDKKSLDFNTRFDKAFDDARNGR